MKTPRSETQLDGAAVLLESMLELARWYPVVHSLDGHYLNQTGLRDTQLSGMLTYHDQGVIALVSNMVFEAGNQSQELSFETVLLGYMDANLHPEEVRPGSECETELTLCRQCFD